MDNDASDKSQAHLLFSETFGACQVRELTCFRAHDPGTFDVILMDIMMPMMDGLTATRAIRALDRPDAKTVPILAMTAKAFDEDAQKCIEAGMNAHTAKPLEIKKLTAVMSQKIVTRES